HLPLITDSAAYGPTRSRLPFSVLVGTSKKKAWALPFAKPSRFRRPSRWTRDGHGAISVQRRQAETSTPASTTWVATQMRPELLAATPALRAFSNSINIFSFACRSCLRKREVRRIRPAPLWLSDLSCPWSFWAVATVLQTTSESVPG